MSLADAGGRTSAVEIGPHAREPLTGDAAAVWAAMLAVYAGFTAGDPARTDENLHPDVTIWDSEHAPMVFGLDGLVVLRAGRSSAGAGDDMPAGGAGDAVAASGAGEAVPAGGAGEAVAASGAVEAPGPDVVLEATDPVIDVWGDTALLRHLLRVRIADGSAPDELVRNTSVWRRTDGRWLAVHNHEDVLAGE